VNSGPTNASTSSTLPMRTKRAERESRRWKLQRDFGVNSLLLWRKANQNNQSFSSFRANLPHRLPHTPCPAARTLLMLKRTCLSFLRGIPPRAARFCARAASPLGDSTVLVTGGSRGIGRVVAKAFADNGATVAVASRDLRACEEVVRELNDSGSGGGHVAVACDVADPAAVKAAVSTARNHMGGLSVLVNAASVVFDDILARAKPDELQQMAHTNLLGAIYQTQECAKHMIRSNRQTAGAGGSIIHISSIVGLDGHIGQGYDLKAKLLFLLSACKGILSWANFRSFA
jgi:hypothetical protein